MKLDSLMLTKQKFTKMLEQTVKEKHIPYIDAIVYLCEETGVDPEDIKKFISPAIKSKIQGEATKLNLMSTKNRSVELE